MLSPIQWSVQSRLCLVGEDCCVWICSGCGNSGAIGLIRSLVFFAFARGLER
jgi:hypothetical protein